MNGSEGQLSCKDRQIRPSEVNTANCPETFSATIDDNTEVGIPSKIGSDTDYSSSMESDVEDKSRETVN
ncbi:unnamed protein product, partial [Allacma fusca]